MKLAANNAELKQSLERREIEKDSSMFTGPLEESGTFERSHPDNGLSPNVFATGELPLPLRSFARRGMAPAGPYVLIAA